jgi:hypothetical protein
MSLLSMSLWRAPRYSRAMPHVPTNAERVRAFRAAMATDALGNAYPWPWRPHQPSAAVLPRLAASLTAQPQPFADEQRVGAGEAGRCETEAGPVAAPGTFDPDSLDVTSDNEPDLPWIGFEGDPEMDIPEF